MTSLNEISRTFARCLELSIPPIAVARVAERPRAVPAFSGEVPSACTLWRRAETAIFYADIPAHLGCPIGAHVMGFPLPPDSANELGELARQMCDMNYIDPAEVPAIPRFDSAAAGAIYGPLADFPIAPEVALLWIRPAELMILQEAVRNAFWCGDPGPSLLGRPACAALPAAAAGNAPALSLGCMGMRTFTEIPPEFSLAVLPGPRLAELASSLERAHATNEKMRAFYLSRKTGS